MKPISQLPPVGLTYQRPPKDPPTHAQAQAGGYPWDDITPAGSTALDDELESDLADAALGLLMTLLLVSATAFACWFVFAKMFG